MKKMKLKMKAFTFLKIFNKVDIKQMRLSQQYKIVAAHKIFLNTVVLKIHIINKNLYG